VAASTKVEDKVVVRPDVSRLWSLRGTLQKTLRTTTSDVIINNDDDDSFILIVKRIMMMMVLLFL